MIKEYKKSNFKNIIYEKITITYTTIKYLFNYLFIKSSIKITIFNIYVQKKSIKKNFYFFLSRIHLVKAASILIYLLSRIKGIRTALLNLWYAETS